MSCISYPRNLPCERVLFIFELFTSIKTSSLDIRGAEISVVRTVSYAAGTFVTFTIKVDRKDREVVISGLSMYYQNLSSFRNLVILSSVCRVDPILPSQLEFMSDDALLGSGGTATVHKAKYLGATVAVKTLLGDDDDSSWEQVVRELRFWPTCHIRISFTCMVSRTVSTQTIVWVS